METKDYLTNYYERYDENGRLISKHGMVEYLTTMKYVEKYLKLSHTYVLIVLPNVPLTTTSAISNKSSGKQAT